jgi:hypothetical protein
VPRKVFVAGEILTAADLQTNAVDQSVMQFATESARNTAIPSPVEGMVTYIADKDLIQIYNGTAWKNSLATTGGILQVVTANKTDVFSTSSTSFTGVTGVSATITPSSTSSKIFVLMNTAVGVSAGNSAHFLIVRGATQLNIGAAAGSRVRATYSTRAESSGNSGSFIAPQSASITFVDTPNTTSATTYALQMRVDGGTGYVGRSGNDGDNTQHARTPSNITLLEVAG